MAAVLGSHANTLLLTAPESCSKSTFLVHGSPAGISTVPLRNSKPEPDCWEGRLLSKVQQEAPVWYQYFFFWRFNARCFMAYLYASCSCPGSAGGAILALRVRYARRVCLLLLCPSRPPRPKRGPQPFFDGVPPEAS